MKGKEKIMTLFVVIVLIIITIGFKYNLFFLISSYNSCQRLRDTELKGILDSVYLDYSNKGFFTIKICNENRCIEWYRFYLDEDEMDFFEKGDSIYKPKGEFKYYLFKKSLNDSLIVLEKKIDCYENSLKLIK